MNNHITDVFTSPSVKHSAILAKDMGLSPFVINQNVPYFYSNPDEIYPDSKIALPIGDLFCELRAVTSAGVKQLRNIVKQYEMETVYFKHKTHEHLMFLSDGRLLELPYDQLCVRSLNDQSGLFMNIKHSYAIIPPSIEYKMISKCNISHVPDALVDHLLALHDNAIARGNYYDRGY